MTKIFYGWWIVFACFFINFFVGGVISFGFTAFVEPLRAEFAWSYTQISLASSLRGLEMGLIAPLVGFLVHRFSSRKLAAWGTSTIGVGLIFLSFTQSLAMFYGAILLLALGASGCTAVVLISAVANWFNKNIGKALGIMASGFGAGGLLVPLIVRLIDLYQWRTALIILGLWILIIGVPLALVIRDTPELYGYLPDGELQEKSNLHGKVQPQEIEIGLKEALKNRSFMYLNFEEAIRMMCLSAVILHVMPYLGSLGIPRATAGLVAAALPLLSIVGRIGYGWIGDLFNKRSVMAIAICSMSVGMLLFCYVQTGWVMILFLFLFSPGWGGTMILRGAILREYFGRRHFSKMLGINVGFAAFGAIIGPTMAGWVFDTFGSYYYIWIFFCVLYLVGLGLTLRLRPLAKSASTVGFTK